ncbi:hypothetical protein CY34DRAFT_277463 [Suillus luteus UH-Slu-Lm8-n1]|uniref:Uncharacterized protein n=1 Tax=Suillus luteus UH-Slu-Lm8-n1 TaxID=930992 RepID=A0A0D0ABC7_9AGAM|nr:hypothetical protein CY34DRAFT_277463 [Suillus luteus UH-Slu-Lm8-n1]
MGAFAFFGPGKFGNLHTSLSNPVAGRGSIRQRMASRPRNARIPRFPILLRKVLHKLGSQPRVG